MTINERMELFHQLLGRIRTFADGFIRRLPSKTLSAHEHDLKSAADISLWNATEKFEPARANTFLPYAYRRARGAVLDELRKIRDAGLTEVTEDPCPPEVADHAEHPADRAMRIADHRHLADCIGTLTPVQQIVIRLRYWNGLTYRDIGDWLSVDLTRIYQIKKEAEARIRMTFSMVQ